MSVQNSIFRISWLKRISFGCLLGTVVLSLLALFGWMTGSWTLTRLIAFSVPMAPSTAYSFLLIGITALVAFNYTTNRSATIVTTGVLALIAFFSLTILFEAVSGVTLDVERIFIETPLLYNGIQVGKMSPVAAGFFLIAALSTLTFLRIGNKKHIAVLFLAIGFVVSVIFDLGYLYGTPLLYGTGIIPPAFSTAISFTLLFVGLVCGFGPGYWPLSLFLGVSIRARIMRGILPITVLIIILSGWLDSVAFSIFRDHVFVTVLNTILSTALLGFIIFRKTKKIGDTVEAEIAARRKAEADFLESEKNYHKLFEGSSDALMMLDENGFYDCNAATLAIFRCRDKAEFASYRFPDFSPERQPDGSDSVTSAQRRITEAYTHGVNRFEWIHRRVDGEEFPAEVLLTVHTLQDRQVLQATVRDITQWKAAEKAILASEKKYRDLIDTMNEGMAARDGNGILTFLNRKACELLGYEPNELIGQPITVFFDEENRKILQEQLAIRLTGSQQSYEIAWKRKDGTNIYTITTPSIFHSDDGTISGALATFTDITERKLAEKAIQESERKYRELIDNMNEGVGIDKDGVMSFMNRRACELLGYEMHEMIGKPDTFFFDEENQKILQQQMEMRKTGIQRSYEISWKRKDGTMLHTINTPSILYDALGNVDGTMAIFTDITARKTAERAAEEAKNKIQSMNVELQNTLQKVLVQNEELDAFSHTVAHDLKNPLSVIISFSDLLIEDEEDVSQESRIAAHQAMNRTARNMTGIIDELLLFANVRMTDIRIEPLRMEAIVDGALQRLLVMTDAYKAVIVHPASWPDAHGYAPWVEEIWANYISNAIKYGGSPPRIELGATQVIVSGKPFIRFWVRDNGKGLCAEEAQRLFLPFSRLKNVKAEGHGLGLSIVRRIVEKIGGEAGVESEGIPGNGCVFFFTLPTQIVDNG